MAQTASPVLRIGLRLLLLGCGVAQAHPLAPALLDVTELDDGRAEVVWKTSLLRAPGSNVVVVLPPHCKTLTRPFAVEGPSSVTVRWTVDCGRAGVVGQRLGFSGLADAKIDGLVRVTLADGRLVRGVVRASEPVLTVPHREHLSDVFRGYLDLGVAHIVGGLDHLLFVAGLVLLVRGPRLLIKTITAFTAGHSITLSLAAVGVVNLPPGPMEALIALSIFFLAAELARGDSSAPTLMRRWPWIIALAFGLLHGFGFAGALREIGLPPGDIPLALFSFNVGIELGQLCFVFVILGAQWVIGPMLVPLPAWVKRIPLYSMGSLAAFWCFERTAAILQ